MRCKTAAPWTCLRCLKRQHISPRHLTTSTIPTTFDRSPLAQIERNRDGNALRDAFDSRDYWKAFAGPELRASSKGSTGLFQNRFLVRADGFRTFAEKTLEKCQLIVTKIHAATTFEDYQSLAKDFDRLSDLLCRVIDVADFVRSTHPERAFQLAAAGAHSLMFEYMSVLNTDTRLNDQLKQALGDTRVTKSWSEEELKAADILKKDFSQSAIDLPTAKRRRFVELSNRISDAGNRFLNDMQPHSSHLIFASDRLKGSDPLLIRQYTDARGLARIPTFGTAASHILRYARDEEVRKETYLASRTAADDQIQSLESLIRSRAELARTAGFESFASMTLSEKMARTPVAVNTFLEALAAEIAPALRDEVSAMLTVKKKQGVGGGEPSIAAWDRDYYRRLLDQQTQHYYTPLNSTSDFFSLGSVMQGLSKLFDRLYGVRLVPREPLHGETWSPDVRRLDVMDDNDDCVTIIYCDLFARFGKSPNPAHFTVRCSRLIPAAEIAEHRADSPSAAEADTLSVANDGMATSSPLPDGSAYQLPTVVLICDFPAPSTTGPPLLPFSSVTTLFHEMGHALHTILGRTKLQNVSGTRCATDFSELPSILMERFARDPAVLAQYARHWETGAPLPPEAAARLGARAARADGPADVEWQVLLALLDQAYHGAALLDEPGWTSDAAAHAVFAGHGAVPEPRGTRWQGLFGHLVGYGATYYAYLFDRAIAARVWEVVFGGGGPDGRALDRDRGEKFKQEVLKWGGGRDPWKCVAGVLGDESLADGGEKAMAEVGRWGLNGKI